MPAGRHSLLDDDSDGFSGEDSVRNVSNYRKPYLSPKDIRYEPGQVRRTTIATEVYCPVGETPVRRMSRYANEGVTPVKTRFRQLKALIRPLHSRYYPFWIALYILLAALAYSYFFGGPPGGVTETVLEPVVVSMGDAVTGMKEKIGDAYVGVRESLDGVYSGVKDRFKVVKHDKKIREEGSGNDTMEHKELEDVVRKELAKVSYEMAEMRSIQETYVDWRYEMNKKFVDLEAKIDADTTLIAGRVNTLETAVHKLEKDIEEKMRWIADKSESSDQPTANFVSLQEFAMHIDTTKKEVEELRRLIPTEDIEKYENLASYTNGASIIDAVTSYSLYSSLFNLFSADRAPIFLLTERQLYPGDCMPLPATGGRIGIKLPLLGHISHIEYYHLYWSEASGIPLSAPKEIKIMVCSQGCTDDDATANCETIAECEYTVENTVMRREEAKRRRIFGVPIECPVKREMANAVIKSIMVEVLSNHGADHTCLYLTRVLGKVV